MFSLGGIRCVEDLTNVLHCSLLLEIICDEKLSGEEVRKERDLILED